MIRSILILSVFLPIIAGAQSKNDSLWNVWNNTSADSEDRLSAIYDIINSPQVINLKDSVVVLSEMMHELAEEEEEEMYVLRAHNSLANAYLPLGKPKIALDHCRELYRLSVKTDYAAAQGLSLRMMGVIHSELVAYDSAKTYFRRAKDFYNEQEDLQGLSSTLTSEGLLLHKLGDIIGTVENFEQTLRISRKTKDYRAMSSALGNLGIIYQDYGLFDKALERLKESKELFVALNVPGYVAQADMNIGILHRYMGQYNLAMDHFEKALKTQEKLEDVKGMISTKSNIAGLYWLYLDSAAALSIFREAEKMAEDYGSKSSLADVYGNMGSVYKGMGNLDMAENYLEKALSLFQELEHQKGITITSFNLAGLQLQKGDVQYTVKGYQRSLDRAVRLQNNQMITGVNIGFAKAYLKSDKIDSAIYFSNKAYESASKSNAPSGLRDAYKVQYLANEKSGNVKKAFTALKNLEKNQKKDLEINFDVLPEQKKEIYIQGAVENFELINQMAHEHTTDFPELSEMAYNNALYLKGLLLKSSTALKQAVFLSEDSLLQSDYNNWIILKNQITRNYAVGYDVDSLEKVARNIEADIVERSIGFFEKENVDWKDIQKELDDNEVAVEFIRYPVNHPDSIVYSALVLRSSDKRPSLLPLFHEGQLNELLGSFPGNNLSYIEQVYGSKKNTKTQLYDLIWKPMEEALEGTKKVYVSPVGLLHKISFAALAKEQDVYLCDVYDIETKSSTGKITLNGESDVAETLNTKSQTTLFGGIEYNTDSTNSNIGWNYLDGSLDETQAIEKILKKQKRPYQHYTLTNATEAQFKQTASESDILHIATHGFFYPDPDEVMEESIDQKESSEDLVFRGGRTGMGSNTFVKSRNPLMRSGLAFAGANEVWNQTNIKGEDGVLTAAEVATIDMRNTDLIVLSACETGLGDIKGSEGVYGLQRSFKMAGVKYLIMSLWQVPDKETAEFMTTFYKYLTDNNNIKKSFNLTQKEMRKKYDPYYWAAFILVE